MEAKDILIRPFDAATDIERLSAIWRDASLKAHPFIGRPRLLAQRKLIEENYLPKSETRGACRAEAPLGFISLLGSFVGGIFIAPENQGQGIGRQLIAHALARKGALSRDVYRRNEQALRFYAALGFREISRRDLDDSGFPHENATLHPEA